MAGQVVNRDQIGWISCPINGCRATVHKSKIGRGGKAESLYWRCECGCIQPRSPKGQAFIEANMEPLEPVQKPAVGQVAEPDIPAANDDSIEKPKKPKKKGWLDALAGE